MDITAAPAELVLGDKTYRMSPLSDIDIAEIDNWLRVRHLRLVRESTAGASRAEARRVMMDAFDYAAKLSWTSDDGAALLSTRDGIAKLLWQGMHGNHSELTVEEVYKLLLDPRTIRSAMDTWKLINGVGKEEAPASGPSFQEEAAGGQGGGLPASEREVLVDASADRPDDSGPAA